MNEPILLKELPKFECLLDAADLHPELDASATFAFLTLMHTQGSVWRRMSEHFNDFGITQGRFLIMMLLKERNKIEGCPSAHTPAALAEMAQISRASVTGLLDSLEKDAFIRREPDPNDRRMLLIYLTEAGEAFMEKLLPVHFRLISELMSPLDGQERETLVSLLTKVASGV